MFCLHRGPSEVSDFLMELAQNNNPLSVDCVHLPAIVQKLIYRTVQLSRGILIPALESNVCGLSHISPTVSMVTGAAIDLACL